jgi:hypothetical protein
MRGDIKFSFLILTLSLTLTLSQRERETISFFSATYVTKIIFIILFHRATRVPRGKTGPDI